MANHSPFSRSNLHEVIFEADTRTGKIFDVVLLIAIIASVLTVMLESIQELGKAYAQIFLYLEWIFTILFTIEYFLRIYVVKSPRYYIFSFYGIVDLLSIIPTYLSLFLAGSHYLLVIRALRLLRVFRIFKLGHYMREGNVILQAMKASRMKIFVFLFFITIIVTIVGSVMYFIEGESNPAFTSIPRSVYWAIVTLTTVGYGDIAPQSAIGQFLSAIVMVLGYAVIAVPTGIVSSEIIREVNKPNTQCCPNCGREGHDNDASFCKYCGNSMEYDDD